MLLGSGKCSYRSNTTGLIAASNQPFFIFLNNKKLEVMYHMNEVYSEKKLAKNYNITRKSMVSIFKIYYYYFVLFIKLS